MSTQEKIELLNKLFKSVSTLTDNKCSIDSVRRDMEAYAQRIFGDEGSLKYIEQIRNVQFYPLRYRNNVPLDPKPDFYKSRKKWTTIVNRMIRKIENMDNTSSVLDTEIKNIEKLAEDYSIKRERCYPEKIQRSAFSKWQKAMQEFLLKYYGSNDKNYQLIKQYTANKFLSTLSTNFDTFQPICTEIFFQMRHTNNTKTPQPNIINNKRVFIVHGHDVEMKQDVHDYLNDLGLQPIILSEQAAGSLTIIEKFEKEVENVGFAIVLLSPCDQGRKTGTKKWNYRARQNVVFEYGYFVARLGRERVVALQKDDVELPTDISGMIYRKWDNNWKDALKEELKKVKMI